MDTQLRRRWPFIAVLVGVFILTGGAGCQMAVSVSSSGKVFYPDTVGSAKVGDPRKGMYSPENHEGTVSSTDDGLAAFRIPREDGGTK